MPATIKIKNSSTANAKPTSSDLVQGELALNVTDRKIFTEDSSGNVVELGANFNGFKNRIINGAMVIDQRNAGASVSITAGGVFGADRWQAFEDTDGTMTMQQSSLAPAGFVNSLLFTTGTADTSLGASQYAMFTQVVEGFNVADLGWGTASAQTITISFWVRSSLTGTFGGALRNAAANRSYPFTFTVNSANTFEYKTVTIAGDTSGTWATDNTAGIRLSFGLGVGSSLSGTAGSWQAANLISATGATSVVGTNGATFYITGVQLEKGATATSFDYRPYGTELALCQRYYDTNTGEIFGAPANGTTNIQWGGARFTVEMRTTPSVVLYGNGVANSVRSAGGATVALNSPSIGTSTKGLGYINVSSGLTGGTFYQAGYTASAEL